MIEPLLIKISKTASTSSLAWKYLAQGQQPPFAIFARQQTAGRGRGRRQWVSPRGNLYLSLVFAITARPLLSLHSVNLTCAWLKTIGIVPTCKWPNDLLYNGKKLAGLLCEGNNSQLIIGIGINVNIVPLVDQAISLKEITGKDYDVESLARSLVDYFSANFDDQERIVERFEQSTANGDELWSDARQQRFYLRQPDFINGHLQLSSLTSGDQITVNSADNNYRSVYQAPRSLPLIVADVGNSAIKIGLFTDDKLQTVLDHQTLAGYLSELRATISPATGKQWLIYCGSVNNNNRQLLVGLAKSHGFKVSDLKTTKPFLYRGKHYPLEQLGIDRLAAIEAYLAEYHDQHYTGIIADFGTATTVDLIDGNSGEHLGGYICAGLKLMIDSLAEASKLPIPQLTDARPSYGTTTQQAISNGVLSMQLAWLEKIVSNYQPAKVIVTGGYHRIITDHLDYPYHLDLTLVLKGLKALVWR